VKAQAAAEGKGFSSLPYAFIMYQQSLDVKNLGAFAAQYIARGQLFVRAVGRQSVTFLLNFSVRTNMAVIWQSGGRLAAVRILYNDFAYTGCCREKLCC
jgi:hypothetical protein